MDPFIIAQAQQPIRAKLPETSSEKPEKISEKAEDLDSLAQRWVNKIGSALRTYPIDNKTLDIVPSVGIGIDASTSVNAEVKFHVKGKENEKKTPEGCSTIFLAIVKLYGEVIKDPCYNSGNDSLANDTPEASSEMSSSDRSEIVTKVYRWLDDQK
ncbi:hypothetical protein BDV96DRAFT_597869 [Lophiotrema nucula]|uniref:Uncharacterized protein n=1 Tax=Lophiotrema nucula TaxID=690887 RepID=A0A6A5ZHZ3_9PLEO|nr:hypothetical protein BDV96DRAFT_597869 [Lophiotrema nucula]